MLAASRAMALLFGVLSLGLACGQRLSPRPPAVPAPPPLRELSGPSASIAIGAPVADEDRPPDGDCNDNGWCWENPRPRGIRARALWGSATDDVWAVAERGMLHWDGKRWSRDNRSFRDNMLWAVWGRDRRDVWVVGSVHGVWHWDGESWTARPGGGSQADSLVAVGGGDDGPVWTAGYSLCTWTGTAWKVQVEAPCKADLCGWPDPVRSAGGGRVVWRERWWNGAALTKDRPSPAGRTFGGTRESVIWLYEDRLEKWDGKRWVRLDEPPTSLRTQQGMETSVLRNGQRLRALWGASDNDVWVVGDGGLILRWNGIDVTRVDSPTYADLSDVWGSGPGDVWATGYGALLHWDGARWSSWTSTVTDAHLNDVWGTDAGSGGPDVWAVGLGGTILRRAHGSWSVVASGVAVDLWGVAGSSPTDVWFVGSRGTILHFDGRGVSSFDSHTLQNLFGVWAPSARDVWAVGANGSIVHWDGSVWSEQASPTEGPLLRIHGVSGNRPYAVDHFPYGVARAFEQNADHQWSKVSPELVHDARFRGAPLDGVDPYVWGTSANGGLLSWDGSRWSSPPGARVGALRAAWASAGGDVWAVGDDATILSWHAAVARVSRSRTNP